MGQHAVLILAFNRPDRTAQLLIKVQELYCPQRLYFAVDGPRANHAPDKPKIQQVVALAETVRSDIKVSTLFRPTNLGCRRAVSEAITWFFQHEEAGIILEDDIEPTTSFFRFCDENLARFENDGTVFHLNGYVNVGDYPTRSECLYRTSFSHAWGWATWRRAWQFYDDTLINTVRDIRRGVISTAVSDPNSRRFYDLAFELTRQGKLDSWAFRWMLSCWKNGGVAITPAGRLVANIGIGSDSTHSRSAPHLTHDRLLETPPPRSALVLSDNAMSEQFHRYFHQTASGAKIFRMVTSTLFSNSVHRLFRRIRGLLISNHPQ